MKRLMIVADHAFVTHALRLALRQSGGFDRVGFVDGGVPIDSSLAEFRPDVVVVDDMLTPDSTLARLRETVALASTPTLVLLTPQMDSEWLDSAFRAGAHAVISKAVHPLALGTLLREISLGNVVHRHRPAPAIADCPLTERELQVLRLAAQGQTNSQIARGLWVKEQTIKFHLSNAYRKLGVTNRTQASSYVHVRQIAELDRRAS